MPKILVNIVKWAFASYLILSGLIWFISPWVVSYFLTPLLTTENFALAEKSSIRYNPFMTNIYISEFELSRLDDATQTPQLSLASAEIELSLWRLLNNTIYVSKVEIDGFELNVSKSAEQVSIAGWPLSPSPETPPLDKTEQSATPNNYKVIVPNVNVVNSRINLDWLSNTHTLALSTINLSQMHLNETQQLGKLSLALKLNDSPINLNAKFGLDSLYGDINYDLAINKLDLAKFNHFIFPEEPVKNHQTAPNALEAGLLSLTYQHKLELNKQSIKNEFTDFDLSLTDLLIHSQGANVLIEKQQLMSNALNVDIADLHLDSPRPSLNGQVSFNLEHLNAYTEQTHLSLANIGQLSIPEISLVSPDAKQQISLKKLVVNKANFSDDNKDDTPSLARFASVNISDIKLSEEGLSVNDIDIFGLGLDIKKTKNAEIAGLITLNTLQDTDATQPTQESASSDNLTSSEIKPTKEPENNTDANSFALAVNQIKLQDTSHIKLIDESVTPPITRTISIKQFIAGPLDNQKPEQPTILTMNGSSNKYAHFKVNADSKPFAAKPFYKLNALFNEVSLPTLSTYIKDALAYEFDSGQLDLGIDVTVEGTDINGETNILLRGVELGAANNPNDEMLASSTSIPFNYALGMLKDSDGNIELDVPLKGSTTAPDFSLQGFITLLVKRATMSAARDYLMTTFVPYTNIVSVSLVAGEYLLKVRFNDLPLTAGEADIPAEAAPFLDQFSTLMKEKEETELTICAYSTPQDLKLEKPAVELSNEQHQQLKDLSLARMNAFKHYMVGEQGIGSSRLLLCSPKVDQSEEAQARLTFTD